MKAALLGIARSSVRPVQARGKKLSSRDQTSSISSTTRNLLRSIGTSRAPGFRFVMPAFLSSCAPPSRHKRTLHKFLTQAYLSNKLESVSEQPLLMGP